MKRIITAFAMFMACLGFVPTQASAQPYGTWAYCNGIYRWGNCNGPTQVAIPSNQLVALPNGYYQNNGATLRCNAPLVGAIAGGTIGSLAKHHTGQAVILGAIAGGVVANELFCERVHVVPASAAVAPVAVSAYTTQVGQGAAVPQSVRGVLCNIDGTVTEVASNEACKQTAMQKAQSLMTVAQAPQHQDPSDTPERQEAVRHGCKSSTAEWRQLNWRGHPQHEKYVCMEPNDTHRF